MAQSTSRVSGKSVIGAVKTGEPVLSSLSSASYIGTSGNDTYLGGNPADTIEGREGDDHLLGEGGHDVIAGEDGNDVIEGGTGDDTLSGGVGDDTFYYAVHEGNDSIDGGDGTDVVLAATSLGDCIFSNVEVLTTGDLQAKVSQLNSFTTINATGALTLIDSGIVDFSTRLTSAAHILTGPDATIVGTAYDDTIIGGAGTDEFSGGDGNDWIVGGIGSDTLNGGAGVDTMTGGSGNDTYYVDVATDDIIELAGEGTDLVYSAVSYVLVGTVVENLILTGTANLNASGNGVGNKLIGNSGKNVLDGGVGNDTLTGGLGDDTYYVHASGDKVVEASGEGYDVVYASATYTLTGRYAEELRLTGSANIDASGNGVSNVLVGNSGNNVLNGLGGNDSLTGGLGADTFLFGAGSRADTVTDFNAVEGDMINVNAYTGGTANAGLVTQVGLNVVIDFGSGNVVTVLNAAQADVLSQIVW